MLKRLSSAPTGKEGLSDRAWRGASGGAVRGQLTVDRRLISRSASELSQPFPCLTEIL